MSSAGDLFKLVGRIMVKNEEANQAIEDTTGKAKDLGDKLESAGTSADTMSGKIDANSKFGTASVFMCTMLANLATKAGELATNLAKSGIGLASDMEQNIGGVETLFGAASETVFKNADNAYKTAGMSANKYMETITGFAAALKQSVETEEEAARIADMAIIDMSDNANKMGTDMTSIQNAYQGFAKQNFTMLDNLKLGYGGTKEEMERLIADAEKLSGQDYDISSLSDIFSAIHDIQTEMGIAGTTAEEASTTLSGSAASAKAAWDNFLSNTMVTVIPKLTELINKIMEFTEKNPETVQKFADAISGLASISFDMITGALQFLVNNGKEVGIVLGTLAVGLAAGAVAAHPFAAAILAIAGGLALIKSRNADGDAYNHFFDKFSDADLIKLQNYVEAAREAQAAQDALYDALDAGADTEGANNALIEAQKRRDAAKAEAEAVDGLIAAYNAWSSGQAESNGSGQIWLDVPPRLKEGSEGELQGELDSMSLEAMAKIYPDLTQVYAAQNQALTFYADVVPRSTPTAGTIQVDGSHATGIDHVPRDNYIARLHAGEAVLTSSEAAAWRSGGMGGTGRLEAMFGQMMTIMQQVAQNTSGGKQVVLDSGVLVGQLAPALDTQLGTISNRKGRRN